MIEEPMATTNNKDKMDKIIQEVSKGTRIGEVEKKKDQEGERYSVWRAVNSLGHAACELYSDGELSFDEAVSQLAQAIGKLKGKEKSLLEATKEKNALDY
ncbi:MAG: hypothetical protein PHN89_05645 [Candidatus Pacebacteria bacterium]|nr:hypothetical protein [Candidatus Paceibacterota bacterium]